MLRYLAVAGLCLVFLAGCVDAQKQATIQADNERERDLNVRIVGEVANFGNLGGLRVDGVGLVTGLAGTGHCPDGYYREIMEQYLLKNMGAANGAMLNAPKDASVRQILDNPDNCLVIATCYVPAGARRGDRFDVEITLPVNSKATSLAGGYLHPSALRVIQTVGSVSSNPENRGSLKPLESHVFAVAQGRLIVGFGGNSDPNELRRARIWQGGASRIARPYQLSMRTDEKSVSIADSVARRINSMFEDDPRAKALHADFSREENQILNVGNIAHQLNERHDPTGMSPNEVAKAMSKEFINVRVPIVYRFNHVRFIEVSTMTPLNDRDPGLVRYSQRCQKMLHDPRFTMAAAMRLEALGRDIAVPILKTGLESDHPFVRFTSAEALAYLGSTAGVEALTQSAKAHSIFAKHATIALASLGESICKDKLAELFGSDDPALRCAAFQALSQLDERDPRLGGQFVNRSFWLNHVSQAPTSMVYFSTSKRAQVVLFGRNIVLDRSTRMIVGDFTVVPHDKQDQFLVKRFTTQREQPRPRVCSNRLDDVLIALADLGATYPDIVTFLRQANERGHINCPIVNWTTPDVTLVELIEAGRQMKSGL
jgi:flagellar basal body P-ring protein FlgI